jgi:microcystin-dependent protein
MAQMLGSVRRFAGNFAPSGFMNCDGTLLPIAQNTALFSLLGTTYGGNGVSDFALPDLRPAGDGGPRQWDPSDPRYLIVVQGVFPTRS